MPATPDRSATPTSRSRPSRLVLLARPGAGKSTPTPSGSPAYLGLADLATGRCWAGYAEALERAPLGDSH